MKRFTDYCRNRYSAFGFAFKGAWDLLYNQAPSKLHIAAFFGMVAICWALDFTLWKWCTFLVCSGMVLAAEALNTAVEYVVDLVSPEYHVLAGKAKDVAAAGVLFASLAAGIVALLMIGHSLFYITA